MKTIEAMAGYNKLDVCHPWDVTRVLARVAVHAVEIVSQVEVDPKEDAESRSDSLD